MSKTKRLRIFAGPNGSGKSTIFPEICQKFGAGLYLNADKIEDDLTRNAFLDLTDFGLDLKQEDWDEFCSANNSKTLVQKALNEGFDVNVRINDNIILTNPEKTNSYIASLITIFLCRHLTRKGISYSLESVMSHPSKLNQIEEAKKNGFKVYLYFVCVEDPSINVSRVCNRVTKGGHQVPAEKIISRYSKTLDLLYSALLLVDNCYFFDNSTEEMKN
jgi:predicted ABC-type ATPase